VFKGVLRRPNTGRTTAGMLEEFTGAGRGAGGIDGAAAVGGLGAVVLGGLGAELCEDSGSDVYDESRFATIWSACKFVLRAS
jgi:hypothetical protein